MPSATGLIARQDRGKIETKPVYVHLGDPIAQAVEDQTPHD